jgi:DNA repair exonuclease SbcCD nuclease subunit
MRSTLVHAADLHLDSPLVGLPRYEGAPVAELRGATRRALENLVSLCLEESARVLLLAGDLYDGDWRDYSTGLFFAAQMARLRESGTRVVWIRGNHDAQSKLTRHLALGDHCVELSARQPETCVLEELGLAVHGQGFFTAAVTEDLSARYPEPIAGVLNIGLLHTALGGRRGHAPYAPCDPRALSARGYDYWALGHVHQREVVQTDPYIVFPGNLQGRHVREEGAKGATLIRVEDGRIAQVEHRALDVARFCQLEVDASAASDLLDLAQLSRARLREALEQAEGRLLCVRLTLRGATRAHAELARDPERARAQLRVDACEIQGADLWLEDVRFATQLPAPRAELLLREDAIGELVRALSPDADAAQLSAEDEQLVQQLAEELGDLTRQLPPEVRDCDLALDLSDPAQARELLAAAKRGLLPRLLGGP